jgi:hypothetical protein
LKRAPLGPTVAVAGGPSSSRRVGVGFGSGAYQTYDAKAGDLYFHHFKMALYENGGFLRTHPILTVCCMSTDYCSSQHYDIYGTRDL